MSNNLKLQSNKHINIIISYFEFNNWFQQNCFMAESSSDDILVFRYNQTLF